MILTRGAVSDVYQDVFQEGSFIGKCESTDVDAFQRAMEGRFPENAILSHDLLESWPRAVRVGECDVGVL